MDERRFIGEVAQRLGCDARRADSITFAVFQELRDRLTPHEAHDVASQLPQGLKRLWLEDTRSHAGVNKIHAQEFVGRVRHFAALGDDAEAERGVLAVFRALQMLLGSPSGTEGEAWDVFSVLPKDLKRLWLAAAEQDRS
jgi:uncharacterized protein (DUF2267 family)